jgi:predicted DsbA family dithiol-disulfide isomerase
MACIEGKRKQESEKHMKVMQVEIWSDIVCPWCYIGKRRFESALANFQHRDQIAIIWRSFELDPHAPRVSEQTRDEMLAKKYGISLQEVAKTNKHLTSLAAQEGLDYHLDLARPANTLDANRLIHLADTYNLQDAMKERLMQAYFTEGKVIGDIETLVQLAVEVGLDAEKTRGVLNSGTYTNEVRSEEQMARTLGISGVPFFVIDKKYGISGAQPTELFQKALERAWSESHPLIRVGSDLQDTRCCDGDSCAI